MGREGEEGSEKNIMRRRSQSREPCPYVALVFSLFSPRNILRVKFLSSSIISNTVICHLLTHRRHKVPRMCRTPSRAEPSEKDQNAGEERWRKRDERRGGLGSRPRMRATAINDKIARRRNHASRVEIRSYRTIHRTEKIESTVVR